jgi:uncharacterized protein (TIGR03790 family)
MFIFPPLIYQSHAQIGGVELEPTRLETPTPSPDHEGDSVQTLPDTENSRAAPASREEYDSFLNYSDVVLIVNDDSQMSKDIADYFVSQRNFPQGNIINISAPAGETVSRAQFDEFRLQIEDNITRRGLTTTINYILTTKGVPLRISGSGDYKASVDSELALILGPNQNSIGNFRWLINPFFNKEGAFDSQKYGMYLVNRLTAYTFDEVKGIIDKATVSLNITGKFILDLDPGKDGSPGYKVGNDWLRAANAILTPRGYDIIHDETNTFINNITGVAGYSSWGSNDGHWFSDLLANSDMESDSDGNDIPNSWYPVTGGAGTVARTDEDAYRNSYSVKIDRPAQVDDYTAVFQNFTVEPDSRYYLSGYANLSSVSGGGSAHLRIRAHNAQDEIVWMKNGTTKTGTTNAWTSMGQIVFEPIEGVRKISVGSVLYKSSGTVYFDYIRLNEIRPHLRFVPGAIAETFVSTGGRSFNYPTSYGQSLVADLLREGVTGVKGYTWEPYLSAISHPDILFDRYTTGHNLAESFWAGSNFVSWMGTVVGDPKCAPYLMNKADLSIRDVFISDENPSQFDDIFINVTIKNKGAADAPTFLVSLKNGSADGEILLSKYVEFGSDDFATVSFSLALDDMGGSNRFVIMVDSANVVMEIFEDNNIETIDLYVNSLPWANVPLPVITVYEDSGNGSLDLSGDYFLDIESNELYYNAVLLDPSEDEERNVNLETDEDVLKIFILNNYTDKHVSIRIYCNDRLPIAQRIYQDTYIIISPVNDPPFVIEHPVPMFLAEDTYAVYDQSLEEIFDDIDSEELFYALEVDPIQNHSEELGGMVNIYLDTNYIVVDAGGDFFGNITVRVYCSDSVINTTEELPYADLIVIVSPVNDPPHFLLNEIGIRVPEDSSDYLVLNLSEILFDVDNDFTELITEKVDIIPIDSGYAVVDNWTLAITLQDNYTDSLTIEVEVSDGMYSDTCYIDIDVTSVNDPPAILIDKLDDQGDGNVSVEYSFFDSDSLANLMKLNISVDGNQTYTSNYLKLQPLGVDRYGGTFIMNTHELNLSAGSHTLKLTLIDNGTVEGHAEMVFQVERADDQSGSDPEDDDGGINETNGNESDDDDDGSEIMGEGGLSPTTLQCIIVLFIAAALAVTLMLIYLSRKKKRDRELAKVEKEEKWKMLFGDGSNIVPPPATKGIETVENGAEDELPLPDDEDLYAEN